MAQTTIAGKFLDPTVISALTEVSADSANDFLLAWDATNSTLTKVKPDNLGMGAATIKTTYASHGLNVGDVIKSSGTADQFNVALATTAAGAEVVGVVTAVSGNDVTITISGEIDYAGNTGFSYLSGAGVGTIVFLSHSSAGDLSATEPSAVGHISKPLAVVTEAYSANSAGKIVLIIQRGEIISTGTDTKAPNDANYLIGTANSSLSAEIVVGTAPGGELGNTWASPTVDSTHSGSAHHAEAHTVVSHSDTTITGAELTQLSGISANVTDTNLNALTAGSGNTTLHSHASGTNVKVGSFTIDTSATANNATYNVTGIGFTPKGVIFFTAQDESANEASVGLDDGTTSVVMEAYGGGNDGAWSVFTDRSIRDVHASGNTFNGSVTALASGQFTITWTKAGSPSGTLTVMYMAIG